jgi:pilus assembly protein CpaB
MNVTRIAILGVAAVAAGAAALLVRGMLGGPAPSAQATVAAPALATEEVLVAAKEVEPGRPLELEAVRWEVWPQASVAEAFITKKEQPEIDKAIAGYIVRAPIVIGQPITESFVVRADKAGFLAALVKPGMRAVSIVVSPESAVGGFILPNDRVDVLLTRDLEDRGNDKNIRADTILRDVRVLAIDQISQTQVPKEGQQWAVGKTATIELTPNQAEMIQRATKEGGLSLALRALGDNRQLPIVALGQGSVEEGIRVIRAGVLRVTNGPQGSPQ